MQINGNWFFQANPDFYDIDGALKELKCFLWQVKQYKSDIHQGDIAYLWKSGPNGGIIAKTKVLDEPMDYPEDKAERKFYQEGNEPMNFRFGVHLQVEKVYGDPIITRQRMKADEVLRKSLIITRPSGTNFPIKPLELLALQAVIGSKI